MFVCFVARPSVRGPTLEVRIYDPRTKSVKYL